MDQNGFNNNNFFQGPVFIEGNTDIDGNLDVTGNINGGGGGNVNNPMTDDLDAGQYAIINLSEISGYEGVLKTSHMDLQNNRIINCNKIETDNLSSILGGTMYVISDLTLNNRNISGVDVLTARTIQGDFNSNSLQIYGDVIVENSLNLAGNVINNVGTIHTSAINGINNSLTIYGDISVNTSLNLSGNVINNVGSLTAYSPFNNLYLDFIPTSSGSANQVLARSSNYNPNNPNTHKLVWADPGAGAVTNPLTSNLDCNMAFLANCYSLDVRNIISNTNYINVNSTMILNNDLNMNLNKIFNISGIDVYSYGVDLKLDLCPVSQGLPSQVLTRDPAFNPAVPSTYKLVWRDPSMSGVNNPMTENLNCSNYSLSNINNIETKTITNSASITCSTPDFIINNGINLAVTNIKFTGKIEFTNPNATLTNNGGLIIDALQIKNNGSNINMSDLTDFANGIKVNTVVPHSGTQITHSAPQINFFNTNLADTSIYIKGGIQFNNGFTIPEIRGDNLFIRGQTALGVATPLNLVGTVLSLGSAISTELVGNVNCQNRLNNLFNDNKMITRNVRTSLYKMYGNNTIQTNFNFVSPVQIDITNGPTIGLSVLKAGSMRSGDKIKIKLNSSLSTSAGANMDLYIYMGTSLINKKLQTSFAMANTSTAFTFSNFIFELDCVITGTTMNFDNISLLTVNKSNANSKITQGTATGVGQEIFTTNDNFIYIFAGVSSVIGTANITIIGESIEHY